MCPNDHSSKQVEASQVTQSMADEAAAGEQAAKAKLTAKEQALEQQKFGEELGKVATAVAGIQTQINTLRQVRVSPPLSFSMGSRP